MSSTPLAPIDVISDLLGSGDFPAEVLNPYAAAWLIIQRLADAGFSIVDAEEASR
jgi:hypothetical protein